MTITDHLIVLLISVQFVTILLGSTAMFILWQHIQELSDWDDDEDDDDGDWWKKANARGSN